jgi:hypothetical protein
LTTSLDPLPTHFKQVYDNLVGKGYLQIQTLTTLDAERERSLLAARIADPGFLSLRPPNEAEISGRGVLQRLTLRKQNDISLEYRKNGFYMRFFEPRQVRLVEYASPELQAPMGFDVVCSVLAWISENSVTLTLVIDPPTVPPSQISRDDLVRLTHARGVFIDLELARSIIGETARNFDLAGEYSPPEAAAGAQLVNLTTILIEMYVILRLFADKIAKDSGHSSAPEGQVTLDLQGVRRTALDTYRTVSFVTTVIVIPDVTDPQQINSFATLLTGYTNVEFKSPGKFIEEKVIDSVLSHAAIMLEHNRILFAIRRGGEDKYMWLARGILVGEVYSHIARINHEYVRSIRQPASEASRDSQKDPSREVINTLSALLDLSYLQTPLLRRILLRAKKAGEFDSAFDRLRTIVEARQNTVLQQRQTELTEELKELGNRGEFTSIVLAVVGALAVVVPILVAFPTLQAMGWWAWVIGLVIVVIGSGAIGLLVFELFFRHRGAKPLRRE